MAPTDPGKRLTPAEAEELDRRFEKAPPQDLLKWALEAYSGRIALAWAGAQGVALIDMMHRIDPAATRVFTLDTGRLPAETYDYIDVIRVRYNLEIEVLFPETAAVEKMVREKGLNLFYHSLENRLECCRVRKSEPLDRKLRTLDAWITGRRRSQGVTRQEMPKVEIDPKHRGITKVNPLADWTTEQVFEYLKANKIPQHKLHAAGYLSIGCAPCTRAVQPGEDERAGRWWWEHPESRECGIHLPAKKK